MPDGVRHPVAASSCSRPEMWGAVTLRLLAEEGGAGTGAARGSLQPPGRGPPCRAGQGGLCLPSLLPLLCLPAVSSRVGLAGHERAFSLEPATTLSDLCSEAGGRAGAAAASPSSCGAGRPEAQRGGPAAG